MDMLSIASQDKYRCTLHGVFFEKNSCLHEKQQRKKKYSSRGNDVCVISNQADKC